MATKLTNGVLKNNIDIRNSSLKRNDKYRLLGGDLPITVGEVYNPYDNEGKKPESLQYHDLISYTYNNETDFSRGLNNDYGRDIEKLGMYVSRGTKPSFRVNNYEGMGDYLSYVNEVYGMRESYAGHLMGLIGIRENAENLAYDIFPDMEGKTFADYINEIRQYTDVKYAMEHDSVGIVKNINVSNALKGVITTNINNYSGKDTRLGMISNIMYANSLMRGAHFNSMRRTKYITENLDTLYGNNLSNVYSLSSIFAINPETGRIPDVVTDNFIQEFEGDIEEYLGKQIFDFKFPQFQGMGEEVVAPWVRGYNKDKMYFGVTRDGDKHKIPSEVEITEVYEVKNGLRRLDVYNEGEKYDDTQNTTPSGSVTRKINTTKTDSLLFKTKQMFEKNKLDTLIARYHDANNKENSLMQSAVHPEAGVSRGRNLLTKQAWEDFKNAGMTGGYTNPYCRVWTNHHQYARMTDLIRPFKSDNGVEFIGVDGLQKNWNVFRGEVGPDRLAKYGVVNKNGMVNITPSKDSEVDVKSCMFSIENLAWKDVNLGGRAKYKLYTDNGGTEFVDDKQNVLSEEQQGPNGGRIMWFPPYDIEFQENVNVKWDSSEFIGRGEPVYTYSNTKRSGTLSFTMLVDNPAILNYWMLDKKKKASEDDEQEILRFFAGCGGPIDPNENITKLILNGEYEGGNMNVEGAMPEKDIIFNVYYPNNFSGKDISMASMPPAMLFGGSGDIDNGYNSSVTVENETAWLGYEMGTNPMSTVFENDPEVSLEFVLDKTAHRGALNTVFNGVDLTNFEKGTKINWKDFINKNYDDIINYNKTTDELENWRAISEENRKELTGKKEEFKKLAGTWDSVTLPTDAQFPTGGTYGDGSIMGKLQKEIVAFDENTDSPIYQQKVEELRGYLVEARKLQTRIIELGNATDGSLEGEYKKICEKVESIFSIIDEQYLKTNALYFYKKHGVLTSASTAADAYANYVMLNKLQEYKTKEEAEQFLFENNEFGVCYVKKENKYYKLNVGEGKINFDNKFVSKKSFSKSNKFVGKCGDKYCVNYNGEIFEFDKDTDAIKCIETNDFLPKYDTEKQFRESNNSEYGEISGTTYVKQLSGITESNVIDTIEENLPKTDDNVVEKYYKANAFATYESALKADFGVVQYFYSGTYKGGDSYKDVQDFVINSNVAKSEFDDNQSKTVTGALPNGGDVTNLTATLNYENGKYQYPFDNDKASASFVNPKSYSDLMSFGLNSTYEVIKKKAGDEVVTCSFAEFYAGINDGEVVFKQFVLDCERAILTKYREDLKIGETEIEDKIKEAEERINYISLVFGRNSGVNKNLLKIRGAELRGDASSDGGKPKNIALSNDRATTFARFLEEHELLKGKVSVITNKGGEEDNSFNQEKSETDISDLQSKQGRKVRVSIVIGADDAKEAEREKKLKELQGKINSGDITAQEMANYMKEDLGYRRYDDERLFFEMLSENDNFAYTQLVKKVKYFTPAFHSITPEGFNARLTFLHQCTRQGPTVTVSDIGGEKNTAANLAFGRAPFCVLRLGDFLNTKIVINSMSISYPDNQWDINPEGIGMQYMMAKVSLNIDILGGSDISAPIKRLQNAVSFNYYANTSIYDNRSDVAIYNGKNGIDEVRQWNPMLREPNGGE